MVDTVELFNDYIKHDDQLTAGDVNYIHKIKVSDYEGKSLASLSSTHPIKCNEYD